VRGGYRDVYVMNADGSGQRRLVQRGIRPRWAPDGQLISFMSRRDDNWEIYVMNADGSGEKRLTRNPEYDAFPAWSPDARKIAFVRNLRNPNIYVMNADGTGQRRLARNAGWLAWSPPQKK
jgi:Tol biopolymer transport system component